MWIPVWNKCKNRGTGFSTVFFTVCSYITIVLEIGTLNFYSWQQVEGDERRDCSGCAGERQDASSVTWRVCCFNNLAQLGAARQQPPEARHHSFLCAGGCCQLSVCPGASPVPWCCHTRVVEGEEGRCYLDEPHIRSIILVPSSQFNFLPPVVLQGRDLGGPCGHRLQPPLVGEDIQQNGCSG